MNPATAATAAATGGLQLRPATPATVVTVGKDAAVADSTVVAGVADTLIVGGVVKTESALRSQSGVGAVGGLVKAAEERVRWGS